MKHLLLAFATLFITGFAFCNENILENATFTKMDVTGSYQGWRIPPKPPVQITPIDNGVTLASSDIPPSPITISQVLRGKIEIGIPYTVTAQVRADPPTQAQIYVEYTLLNAQGKQTYTSFGTEKINVTPQWSSKKFSFTIPKDPRSVYLAIRSCQGSPVTIKELSITPSAKENVLENAAFTKKNVDGSYQDWRIPPKPPVQITPIDNGVTLASSDTPPSPITISQVLKGKIEIGIPYTVTAQVRADPPTQAQIYVEYTLLNAQGKQTYTSFGTEKINVTPQWSSKKFSFTIPQTPQSVYFAIRSCQGNPVTFKNLSITPSPIRKELNGYWLLENQVEIVKDGAMITKGKPATLCSIPVTPGKTYRLQYDCQGYGSTGNDYIFHPITVHATPYGIKGGYFFNDVRNTLMPKSQKLGIPANARYKTINLQFSTTSTGKVHINHLTFSEYIPDVTETWRLFLETPCYRDMIFSSHDAGVIEGIVEAQPPAVTAVITIPNIGNATAKFANGKAFFSIPAQNLKNGKYPLTCTIQDAAGKSLKEISKAITKVPQAPREVLASKNRYFLINGSPFFPIHLWSAPFLENEACLYQAARNGINSVSIHISNDTERTREMLDYLDKYGIKAIVNIGYCTTLSPKELNAYRLRITEQLPPELRQHPAFLGYFMVDEPLWGGRPAAPLQATLEILKEFDPYHPVWINAAPRNEIEDLIPYGEACDIFGVDIYPIPYPCTHSGLDDKGITSVGKYTTRMLDTTFWRKPNWMVLQGFAWAALNPKTPLEKHIYPTDTQMRFMTYDTMMNGCTGYSLWGLHHIHTPSYYETLFSVTRELHAMSGLYTQGQQEPDLKLGTPDVRIVPFSYKNARYFAVMNLVEKENEVTFNTTLGKQTYTIYKTNASRLSPDGNVTLKLPPYGVVFFGNAPLPAPTWSLPAPNAALDAIKNPIQTFVANSMKKKGPVHYYTGTANWIWNDQNHKMPGCQTLLAHDFDVADVTQSARLLVAVDDSSVIYLNGKKIGKTQSWDLLTAFDLKGSLKPGKNLLMIYAADSAELPCGVLAELQIGGKTVLKTDATWLAAPVTTQHNLNTTSTQGFKPAIILAPYGGGAWGKKVRLPQ